MTEQSPPKGSTPQYVYLTPQISSQDDDKIDLLSFASIFWKWRWFIGSFAFFCTLIAVYVTLFVMPILYTSNSKIQPSQISDNPLRSLGAAAQFLPLSLPSQANKSQIMLNYLSSRKLKSWLISEFGLLQRYNPNSWDEEEQKWLVPQSARPSATIMLQEDVLSSFYSVSLSEDTGLIQISFIDKNPVFAAQVVSGVIGELDRYLTEDYITDAKRNRIFIEEQLNEAQKNLEYWEKMVPKQSVSASQIRRELAAATQVYTELKKQFELAKIEEDKQLVSFKVLDPPLVPEKRSSPARGKICVFTMVATGFLSLVVVLFVDAVRRRL